MEKNSLAGQAIAGLLLPLSSLLSGAGLLVVGVGLLFSVLGLRAVMADFSTMVTGLIMSAYFVGYILGTYLCPAIIRRVGHIRAFAAMASIASTVPILHALWVDPWFWGALRLIAGICLVGLYIVIESWLNALAPSNHRGKVFSIYMSVTFIALALGQWLILVGEKNGFVQFALVSVLFSFALLPITLTPIKEPVSVAPPQLGLRNLYHISPLGFVGAIASGLLNGAFYGMGAVYAQAVGFSDMGVATFMAATILGGALFQWPVGHYSDRHDRRFLMLWICIGSACLATLGFFFSRASEETLILIGILYGGFVFTLYGLSVAHVNDLIDPSRVLEVTGGLLLLHGIGAVIGPTVAGAMMDILNPESLMLYFALVLSLFAVFAVYRIKAAPAVPESEKSHYVVMTGSSPVILQVDSLANANEENVNE
ncbi:Putative permease of the major facilitator superfamily [Herminiimonas arsenicoxydans]|uniref:Permease of the major facilitator superfamily n=1 Tax=Herminiimonas arsenicoxydans TaxID=204773 RepID=A4G839_HERAR|nr:Putative permease of the major facilitator superfamily [Herminiimonas arsenicoxydans]